MHDDNSAPADSNSSATGILLCLRMLAEEAEDLRLAGTLQALREAIAICQTERTDPRASGTPAMMVTGRTVVH